jgi:hypothetical protein
MTVPSNNERVARFARVLKRYGTDNTGAGCLTDLLADARHWCDRHGEDYAALDRRAYDHYLTEVYDERVIP